MLRSLFSTFCAVWLFLSPCLCSAGVLQHACECVEEAVGNACESHCQSHQEFRDPSHEEHDRFGLPDGGCSHDGCENDPCQAALTVNKKSSPKFSDSSDGIPPPATLAVLYGQDSNERSRSTPLPLCLSRPRGTNSPYFLADVPLLI
jgi:hypothetical protein